MLIDVARPELWEDLNDLLKVKLSIPNKVSTRAYRGLNHAAFEVAQGTSHFMAHKKSIAVIQGQTPVFEHILPYYYKEAYQVQAVTREKIISIPEWVESLNKDTLFVLLAEDHPVTGEIFPGVDELDRCLNEKRITVIRISHALHYFDNLEIQPYTVRLCSYGSDHAIAYCGERFRSPPLAAHGMAWDAEKFVAEIEHQKNIQKQESAVVEKFESQFPQEQRFFQNSSARIFDRAICVFPDVSGEAVVDNLKTKIQFQNDDVVTTNLCYWKSAKTFKAWWKPCPTDNELRGMIIISARLLSDKDFAKHFVSAYEDIKQKQSWDLESK